MDSSWTDQNGDTDDRVDSLVYEYFDRRRSGEELTAESFIADHPEHAEQLRSVLEGLSLLGRIGSDVDGEPEDEGTAAYPAGLPAIAGYELQEEIGSGGMGVVYRALQVSTNRVVAVKVLLAGPFASGAMSRRFEREVQLAARLQHPNIIRVLESGRMGRQQYYSMDYVAGVPLDRHLRAAQLDRAAILRIFVQICDAVEYAHSQGVVHRDLKPANVLMDDEGAPHILDFGLAKAVDQTGTEAALVTRVSAPGQIMGTLPYISPEQIAAEPGEIDARTDVYSLGVMLYEALTGAPPYEMTGRPSDIIRRIFEENPKPPSSFPKWRDGELDTIILKSLEKEKDRRYQSAREFSEDLRRYLEGEPILARRPSGLYVLRKRLRKHRVLASVGAALLLAAVVIVIVAIADSQRQRQLVEEARRTALVMQNEAEAGDAAMVASTTRALMNSFGQLHEPRLVLAQALYRSGQQEHAIVLLERALAEQTLQFDLEPWPYRALLGEIYRATGDTQRAEAMKAGPQEKIPDTAEAWYLRSLATLDLSEAMRCATEAVRRDPSDPLAWIRLTRLRMRAGDFEGALQGADRLLELGERSVIWNGVKGYVLAFQGRFEEGIEQFTQALAAEPDNQDLLRHRAHLLRRVGDYQGAIADYTRVLEAAEEQWPVVWDHYQRATPLWIVGRTEEALQDYRRVRILLGRPHFSDVRACLILRYEGRQAEAQEVLDAALRDVTDSWLRQVLRCLDGRITPQELVADATGRTNPEQICEACYYAGEMCLLAGRLAEARVFFERCVQTGVEFDPDTALGTPMNEFELAQWRLETLFEGSATTESEED